MGAGGCLCSRHTAQISIIHIFFHERRWLPLLPPYSSDIYNLFFLSRAQVAASAPSTTAPEGGLREECVAQLQGHIHCISSVAFATDTVMFSGGWDHSVSRVIVR